MASPNPENITILGAGVVGITTALVLSHSYPTSKITVVAKHFPGDRSIEYTSPWAGASWSSMANDNGPLEKYDEVTYKRWGQLIDGECVFGCKAQIPGEGNEMGLERIPTRAVFDAPIEETGVLTKETGKIWYDQLVGGVRELSKEELPKGAVCGLDMPNTYRINTQVHLQWLLSQVLSRGIKLVRRHYSSIKALLADLPATNLLINCAGIGPLHLTDVKDTKLYPTRGQTLLVAEPRTPIKRLYEFERQYIRSPEHTDRTTTYVFPRPLGGGIILGGSRQDGNWSDQWDEELGKDIMKRCCELCPELGKPEELQIISKNIGLRPARVGGTRVETEKGKWNVPVIHCYGHGGAGYQSSWGTAEKVLELIQKAHGYSSKL